MSEFGIQNSQNVQNSETRENLMKLIYNATDSEIEFYYQTLNAIVKNISLIKN